MRNKIIIVTGDPNSINSEIIYKVWKKLKKSIKKNIYFISNFSLLNSQFKKLNYSIKATDIKNIAESANHEKLKVINIDLKFKNPFNVSNFYASKFVKESLNCAHDLCLDKTVKGMINCPINKKLININSNKNLGITEYLAKKCNVKNNSEAMLISNKRLIVTPITTHIDIRDVSKKINKKIIIKKIKTINTWFYNKFKKKPNFGVLGLNPHNSELKKNSEKKKIILPAIKKLRGDGLNIKGPLIADTTFINDFKNYDVIIGMYHDQVLTPFKTLFKFDAINMTLGLKYLRVSPDHGVAKDIIGKNRANEMSLQNCINFIYNSKNEIR